MSPDQRRHAENMEEIALANYQTYREAQQHSINYLHRSLMISILSLMVAIAAVVIAIKIK